MKLESAIKTRLTRKGDALKVEVLVGNERKDVSADFTAIKASAPLKFDIDVHGHGHVIFLGMGENPPEVGFSTRVPGRFWGLVLDRVSSLTKAKAGNKKHEG